MFAKYAVETLYSVYISLMCDDEVTAVDHPYLRNYVDVIVFSVKGKRRLIDFLAGGKTIVFTFMDLALKPVIT